MLPSIRLDNSDKNDERNGSSVSASAIGQFQYRSFSSTHVTSAAAAGGGGVDNNFDNSNPDNNTKAFDAVMDTLFTGDKDGYVSTPDAAGATAQVMGATADVEGTAAVFEPVWYNLADQAICLINSAQQLTGMQLGETIILMTAGLRVVVFPLFVIAQRNSSRMAHMKPEMDAIKAKSEMQGGSTDPETQRKLGLQLRALFQKYDCNPARAIALPLVQIPLFMSMFFGLQKMPRLFPEELSNGGILWFTDLTVPDPTYALPIISAGSFLASIEMNKAQTMASNPQQGMIMTNVFRVLAVLIVPMTIHFPTCVYCYWATNNFLTTAQGWVLQQPSVKKALGIWELPKPVPGQPQAKGIIDTIKGMTQRKPSESDQIKAHNNAVAHKKRITGPGRRPHRQRNRRR